MSAQEIEPGEAVAPDDDRSAVKTVADTAVPLEVGAIALGPDGHIQHNDEDRPLHFSFTACGIRFEADLQGRCAPLRIKANLGKLPYSAESPEGRRLARSVLAATDRLHRGQILLSDKQDMVLHGELTPPSPRTPVSVIATAAALIVDFKPYVDMLADALAARPLATGPRNEGSGDALPTEA